MHQRQGIFGFNNKPRGNLVTLNYPKHIYQHHNVLNKCIQINMLTLTL